LGGQRRSASLWGSWNSPRIAPRPILQMSCHAYFAPPGFQTPRVSGQLEALYHALLHIHTNTLTRSHAHAHLHPHLHTYTHMHMHTHIHVHINIHIHIHIHNHIHIQIRICIRIRIHIHVGRSGASRSTTGVGNPCQPSQLTCIVDMHCTGLYVHACTMLFSAFRQLRSSARRYAWTRSRMTLAFRTFFDRLSFQLLTKQPRGLVTRRVHVKHLKRVR
jgi:hypothetical protein